MSNPLDLIPRSLEAGEHVAETALEHPCWLVLGPSGRPVYTVHHHEAVGAAAFACMMSERNGWERASLCVVPGCGCDELPPEGTEVATARRRPSTGKAS